MLENMAVVIAVITGLTEVVKRAGVRTKYIPMIAVAIGIIYGLAIGGFTVDAVTGGIVAGLTSVGLFRLTQKAISG